jgi:capsular polysaccharide biosynthesis protein
LLQTAMTSAGLSLFDPGSVGWVEQIRVFSNARLIVAEAGAALANLVFRRPGANVIILVNGHKNSNYYYLSQLAGLLRINGFFFECYRLVGSHALGVQDDMIVPVSSFTEWVRGFLSGSTSAPYGGNLADLTAVREKRGRR